jgi:hypothetical protein
MSQDSIAKRRRELHDAYFQERDLELLDFLKDEEDAQQSLEDDRLQSIAGVHSPEVLAALKSAGITSSSMTAFMLLPLVRLAWADAKIQDGEFQSILKAAEEDGIAYGTPSYRLLNRWLEERPNEKVLEAWYAYARELAAVLDEPSLAAFQQATLGRAMRVAQASGGVLGLGEKVSENERHALHDLEHALTKPKLG